MSAVERNTSPSQYTIEGNLVMLPGAHKPVTIASSIGDFYSKIYQEKPQHSPPESSVSLANRAMPFIREFPTSGVVVGVGAGRQNVERHIKRAFYNKQKLPFQLITLDIADIDYDKLQLGTSIPHPDTSRNHKLPVHNVLHLQASGSELPLSDGSVDVVISNMAYDFMPEGALDELYRVLKPGGRAFINLSYPALDRNTDIKDQLASREVTPSRKRELLFWQRYLQDNDILIDSPEKATEIYSAHGFMVNRTATVANNLYDWCEVDLYKPTEEERQREQARVQAMKPASDIYPGSVTYEDYVNSETKVLDDTTVVSSSPLYEANYAPHMNKVIDSRVFQKRALQAAGLFRMYDE